MVVPEIYDDENVLLKTPGVAVKSIPFEGILTSKRIILADPAKGHLPPKEILLSTITAVEGGENAIRDQTLTLFVKATTGEVRQMILTFSQRGGGSRIKERQAWERAILENIPAAPATPRRVITASQPMADTPSRISIVTASPQQDTELDSPAPLSVPEPRSSAPVPAYDAPAPAQHFFCSRCGNKVPVESAFCNRCGSPVVPPKGMTPTPPSITYPEQPRHPVDQPVPAARTSGKLTLNIPDDPVPKTRPDPPVRQQSPAWDEEETFEPEPVRKPKKGKRDKGPGLLSGIFSSKKSPKPASPKPPRSSGGFKSGRKLLLGIGAVIIILVILAAGAFVVYPMLASGALLPGPGATTDVTPTPTSSGSSTTVTDPSTFVPIEIKTADIPPTGVQVHVYYIGGFKGSYGMQDAVITVPGNSGDRVWEVEDAKGHVIAEFSKDDKSSHELLVEIYKDGVLLTSDRTTEPFGSVRLSADIIV